MSIGLAMHDPDSTALYSIDWAPWLGGGAISSSTWTVLPSGPTLSGESLSGTVTSVKMSGGTRGVLYQLVNTVTTATGVTEQRAIVLRAGDL